MTFGIFIAAFIILAASSKIVIDSAIKISEHTGISQLAIGFILVAVAVSVPDLVVSVMASFSGKPLLAIGDALGSSIANICLVLGIATLVRKVSVERKHTIESAELLLLISLIPMIILSRAFAGVFEGLVLILAFIVYAVFTVREKFTLKLKADFSKKHLIHAILLFFAGMAFVITSSSFVVSSAAEIAKMLGISDAIIGLTLISFGTTLPELAVDFTAIRRGQIALAIGDILGSTVVNLTLVLGSALVISPTAIDFSVYSIALAFIVIANSFLFYNLVKHEGIGSKQGIVFIIMYVLFILLMLTSKGIPFIN